MPNSAYQTLLESLDDQVQALDAQAIELNRQRAAVVKQRKALEAMKGLGQEQEGRGVPKKAQRLQLKQAKAYMHEHYGWAYSRLGNLRNETMTNPGRYEGVFKKSPHGSTVWVDIDLLLAVEYGSPTPSQEVPS